MQAIVGLMLRHLLTGVGGALVMKGVIAASMVDPLVGAVSMIAGVIWSIIQKKRSGAMDPQP